jgi:hypothetical protein
MAENRLRRQIARSLQLPETQLAQWQRDGVIVFDELPGGWVMRIDHEPALSSITAAALESLPSFTKETSHE